MKISLEFVILFSFVGSAVTYKERTKRQINFGGGGGRSPSGSNNGGTVSFGEDNTRKDVSSLKDFLQRNGDGQEKNSIGTRFIFGGNSKKYGASCTTPDRTAGSCRYITDRQCSPILNLIVSQGVSNRILTYLYAAIRSPCGFEGFDFTMCCADPEVPPPTNKPVTQRCGMPQTRIVGGEFASPGEWPWMVVLGKPASGFFGSSFQVSCGGTVLNEDTILTAAHCFGNGNQDPTTVHLKDTDLVSSGDGKGIDVPIGQIFSHPGWNSATLANDIAIVKLSRRVTFDRNVQSACLPYNYQGKNLFNILKNPAPTVAGWGSERVGGPTTSKLKQAKVAMKTQSECRNAYRNVGQVSIDDTKICAGEGKTDSCNGDSGGPLLSNHLESGWTVVGVTSFGVDCARPDFPGVYTRVDKYLNWIEQHL